MKKVRVVEAAKRIRAAVGGSRAIIAIISCVMAGDRERFLSQGFDDYIVKPIDPHTIVKEIEEYANKTDRPRGG
ncbi:MAG: hypothetical protein U9N43_01245 [Euryarchaeota archaeon]|nr:hypothetical protein [Euryarchaeota archaeon]